MRVEIDTRAGTVTVTDNGHGVFDLQDLINIGKSDRSEGVRAERPAGMGLFSVFKLGGLPEVRSGRWQLTLDYDAMCAGKAAVYEGLPPALKGTQVRVSRLHHPFGSHDMPHIEGYARRVRASFTRPYNQQLTHAAMPRVGLTHLRGLFVRPIRS